MGKVISLLNPFKNFNVEYRAHKIISREKPTVAPLHRSDKIDIEKMMKGIMDIVRYRIKKIDKAANINN